MAKPTPVPTPEYAGPVAKRIRAVRHGNNDYSLIVETFAGPPIKTEVLKEHSALVPAQDRVRLWHENNLGPNRLPEDSGLA